MKMLGLQQEDPNKTAAMVRDTELFLFDLDGTLYLGNTLFDFTLPLLNAIRAQGKRYMFMTNNSSKSVSAYVDKLTRLGVAARPEDFVTSAQATMVYLRQHYPDLRLYVCGTRSLQEELTQNGFAVTEDPDRAECLLMGFDTELTFAKLDGICRQLSTREIPYVATHPDSVCPTEYGSVPDCGSVCDMVYNATKKRPEVVGKPQPLMAQMAMERWGVSPRHTAVVGDRLNTDIRCGINAGARSFLVLTGETTREMLADSRVRPDAIMESAEVILRLLTRD